MIIKEVCIESYKEAKKAVEKGGSRIEFCENLAVGGTTPSYGSVKKAVENLKVPIVVMIRPRGGDFTYSEDELWIMEEDIENLKTLGVDGFVFGFLKEDKKIDIETTRRFVELARPAKVTYHKAFDEVEDMEEAMLELSKIGVDRVLTSGGKRYALDGVEKLNSLIKIGDEVGVQVVVAGGVTDKNLKEVSAAIKNTEYHGKLIVGDLG